MKQRKIGMVENCIALYSNYRLFVNYCIIGVTGVVLDMMVFSLLTCGFGWYYQYANIVSVSCGIGNNFFWNAHYNFKQKTMILLRFVSFYCVGFFGLAISAGCLFAFVGVMHMNQYLAKGVTIFIVTLVQFFLNKKVTFKNKAGD